jgi:ring-1,2-phenylacetyl-CoA epoxidase subunit PaaD
MVTPTPLEAELRALAGAVPDPELPVLTLAELGVVRGLHVLGPGRVEVELTPTYTGCPAVGAMAEDIRQVLHDRGIPEVEVRVVLSPPWSTDAITAEGRRKLTEAGIAPPRHPAAAAGPGWGSCPGPGARRAAAGRARGFTGGVREVEDDDTEAAGGAHGGTEAVGGAGGGPVAVELGVRCPHCGSIETTLLSRFSSTACTALHRCETCREPFDHMKEL